MEIWTVHHAAERLAPGLCNGSLEEAGQLLWEREWAPAARDYFAAVLTVVPRLVFPRLTGSRRGGPGEKLLPGPRGLPNSALLRCPSGDRGRRAKPRRGARRPRRRVPLRVEQPARRKAPAGFGRRPRPLPEARHPAVHLPVPRAGGRSRRGPRLRRPVGALGAEPHRRGACALSERLRRRWCAARPTWRIPSRVRRRHTRGFQEEVVMTERDSTRSAGVRGEASI